MRIIRAETYQAVPWKNGRGITLEIARHPAGEVDFIWRLSLAEITQSCAFSAFPGYDRTIVLLAGDGFALTFADGRTHDLIVPHAPFHFDGGAAASCTVAGGPSKDLNLMVRRDAARATCEVRTCTGSVALPPVPGAMRLIVSLGDDLTVRGGDGPAETLAKWDTVCIDAAGPHDNGVTCQGTELSRFCHAVVTLNDIEAASIWSENGPG